MVSARPCTGKTVFMMSAAEALDETALRPAKGRS